MSTTAMQCKDCEAKLVRGCFGLTKLSAVDCAKCQKTLCLNCAGDQTLIPFDKNEEPLPLKKSSIKSYCGPCFKQVSILDYSKSYDIIEPSKSSVDPDKPNITLLWVHASGGSRAMFRPHASTLAQKGYRSILMDLPGHGTLVETTLTLNSCVETVKQILDQECSSHKPSQIIYIGGSLGAYVGFYILGELNSRFGGAILMDCGQNVGPDCSLKARAGIWFLRKLSGSMRNKTMMGVMMGAMEKSSDYHTIECCYAGSMFFQQGPAQCDCMHTVAPSHIIPTLNVPILFFNGSGDHRDSENKWLALCKDERSSLKVYEGGDHFFCHELRFVDDMLHRMDTFFQMAAL